MQKWEVVQLLAQEFISAAEKEELRTTLGLGEVRIFYDPSARTVVDFLFKVQDKMFAE